VDFKRFDAFLMAIKDRNDVSAAKPPAEYFYAWWYAESTDPQPAGQQPAFIGRWAEWPPGTPRTPEQIANWDAVTVVNGLSNSDATVDAGYTVEMRFNLTPMGYDVTQPAGDVVEWNISIYDCDWFWPIDVFRFSSNRVWWQSPWGNAAWFDELHVYASPFVTTSSGTLPTIHPELFIPNGAGQPAPTIDGMLSEAVWSEAYTFDIRYGDTVLRATYPGVGPYRSGQFQPEVNGGQAFIADPADATVRMFFRDDNLYLGFDVRDRVVQYHPNVDRWDGFLLTINERQMRGPDNNLMGRRLSFQVNQDGTALPQDYLNTLVGQGDAQVALMLKSGTTVDTLGLSPDTGYTAEVEIDLTALGYPSGLGDGTLFLGVNHLDGDSFVPFTDSYGTRTWWFREYEDECCPIWAYLAPNPPTDIGMPDSESVQGYALLGTYPNPGRQSTIRYALARPSDVMLQVFDVRGRLVEKRLLGLQHAGVREAFVAGVAYGSGVYWVRLNVSDPVTGEARKTLSGRLLLVK
jgi:hypothetical protein